MAPGKVPFRLSRGLVGVVRETNGVASEAFAAAHCRARAETCVSTGGGGPEFELGRAQGAEFALWLNQNLARVWSLPTAKWRLAISTLNLSSRSLLRTRLRGQPRTWNATPGRHDCHSLCGNCDAVVAHAVRLSPNATIVIVQSLP